MTDTTRPINSVAPLANVARLTELMKAEGYVGTAVERAQALAEANTQQAGEAPAG